MLQEAPSDVAHIPALCEDINAAPEGSTRSYGNRILIIPSLRPNLERNVDARLAACPIWPRTFVKEVGCVKHRRCMLCSGGGDFIACRVSAGAKSFRDVHMFLNDKRCIVFDATCSGTTLRNVTFEGAIITLCRTFS